jgi:hypothetical protein
VNPQPCAMASLVEAGHDGRLGEREAASVARHVLTCTACRALERELDDLRALLRQSSWKAPDSSAKPGSGTAPTPLEHQRGRLALLRAAASPPPSSRRGRRGAVVAVAAAAAVVALLLAWAVPRSARPSLLLARHLPAPVLHAAEVRAEVTPERSYPAETTIRSSAEARFDRRAEDRVDRVALAEGTLDLAVRKLSPGERFLVATEDAEVEVRGTRFEVEAHAGRIARVAVSEGKVEVRYGGAVSVIVAGGAWQPPVVATTAEGSGERRDTPLLATRARAPAVHVAAVAADSEPRPAPREHPGASPGAKPEGQADPSKAFGDAVDLLGRGDYAAARSQLDAFRAAHPGDGRADLAAFLSIVSLQRAGRRAEAQEAARRYLELYPNGDRRAEASRVASGR